MSRYWNAVGRCVATLTIGKRVQIESGASRVRMRLETTTTTISQNIAIVVVDNNVRMPLKTTTINASFFTYLFVNSGGIFHLLWGDHSGSEYTFSFQISFAQGSGVWSNLEFEVALWLFLGLKEKNTSKETFDQPRSTRGVPANIIGSWAVAKIKSKR